MSEKQKSFWGGSIVTGLLIFMFTGVMSWGGINIQENRDARIKLPLIAEKFEAFTLNQTLQNKAILDSQLSTNRRLDDFLIHAHRTDTRVSVLETKAVQCEKDVSACKGAHYVK